MLRLPDRGPQPVGIGRAYRLQVRAFAKAIEVITVITIRREPLAALSLRDARHEGFGTVEGALRAWRRVHGEPADGQIVWAIGFVRGTVDVFDRDTPVYLMRRARDGGMRANYTTRVADAVVENGVAVEAIVPPITSERARIMADARRLEPERDAVRAVHGQLESLRQAMSVMKHASLIRRAERAVAAVDRDLSARVLGSGPIHGAADGIAGEADLPDRAA